MISFHGSFTNRLPPTSQHHLPSVTLSCLYPNYSDLLSMCLSSLLPLNPNVYEDYEDYGNYEEEGEMEGGKGGGKEEEKEDFHILLP